MIRQRCITSRLYLCDFIQTNASRVVAGCYFFCTAFEMNAVYKTHLLSLSYSRRLAGARMKRELAKLDRPNCFEPSSIPSNLAALSRLTPNVCHARNVHQLVIEDKCDVSANEIRRIVRSRLSGFKEGYSCIAVNCPACSHSSSRESSSDLGKLYINLRTGYCFCTQCFLQGPWSSLEVFLKALETSNPKSEKASCKRISIVTSWCRLNIPHFF